MAKKNKYTVTEMPRKLWTQIELTQKQFAAKIGVTWSTINEWEKGRGNPSPPAMRKIKELQD